MYWIIVIVLVSMLLFVVWVSTDLGCNIDLKVLCKGKTKEPVVALTFDDGPDEKMTMRVLEVLKRYDVKATFFLVGSKVQKYPQIVKSIVSEGHTVANHTYSHKNSFPLSSLGRVNKELQMCNDAISEIVDKRVKLFRPPFGVTNPIIGRAVRRVGFNAIGWSIRSFDTFASYSRDSICRRVLRKLHPGAIILLHDRCPEADVLLEKLIPAILERGYRFVSLSEMLDIDVYED